jgi:hypothetical protein
LPETGTTTEGLMGRSLLDETSWPAPRLTELPWLASLTSTLPRVTATVDCAAPAWTANAVPLTTAAKWGV